MTERRPDETEFEETAVSTGNPGKTGETSQSGQLRDYTGMTLSGRYEISKLVGQGGMGALYAGQHVEIGRKVAIKVLHKDFRVSDDVFLRFKQEASLAATLTHHNICSVYDFGKLDDGTPYLVMDLLQGKTLSAVLESEGRLGVRRAVRIIAHICDALTHAHAKSVVHRDLKPSNIMLDGEPPDEMPKIVDFGIAKSLQTDAPKLTATHETIGSPYYMSPEQCQALEVDHRTDIYSLGCLMYECLTGRSPFKAASALQTMYLHVHSQPEPFKDVVPDATIPPELEEVVLKAMHKDPAERYQTADEMKNAAFAAVGAVSFDCLLIDPNSEQFKKQLAAMSQAKKNARAADPQEKKKRFLVPALAAVAAATGLVVFGFANQADIELILDGRKPGEIYNGDDARPLRWDLKNRTTPQVHAVYLGQGHDTPRSKDNDESIMGHATVRVTGRTPEAILILASHAQIEWKVVAAPGTKIEKILIYSTYGHPRVKGVPQDIVKTIEPVSFSLLEGENLQEYGNFAVLNKEVGEALGDSVKGADRDHLINTFQYAQQLKEFEI